MHQTVTPELLETLAYASRALIVHDTETGDMYADIDGQKYVAHQPVRSLRLASGDDA